MKIAFILFTLLILISCPQQHFAASPAPATKKEPFSDMWPSGDKRFTVAEQRAVTAAKAYLEEKRQKPLDARYRVKSTSEGYEAFIMFVGSYDKDGRPLYYPGGHGWVYLKSDFTFIRYMLGQ